jgi:hypothetical protein
MASRSVVAAPFRPIPSTANSETVHPMELNIHGRQSVHPLEGRDRPIVDRLLTRTAATRTDQDVVDVARLMTRYRDFPGAIPLKQNLIKAARGMGFTGRDDLNAAARSIWQSGFRPTQEQADTGVGSGADVQAAE